MTKVQKHGFALFALIEVWDLDGRSTGRVWTTGWRSGVEASGEDSETLTNKDDDDEASRQVMDKCLAQENMKMQQIRQAELMVRGEKTSWTSTGTNHVKLSCRKGSQMPFNYMIINERSKLIFHPCA